jgi:Ca-activated chloride channel family protein
MNVIGLYFAEPLWLIVAGLVPLIFILALRSERQRGSILFPGARRLRGYIGSWRVFLVLLPLALACLALLFGALALARPQKGTLKESVTTRGVDIVVALDVSGSMAAEDFTPRNRLTVATQVVSDFVKKRLHDRVGLVIFAAKSLTKVPPTTDQAVLLRQLDDIRLDMLPDGTAIGSGLATALTRLRRSQARSRIVVLVTDGGNNAGEIDPDMAADLARAMEVRIYTIGVGRQGEVPMPVQMQDPFTGAVVKRTMPMEVKYDEELLQRIATRTGGEFFQAGDPDALRQVFERIDRLERSEIKLTSFKRYRELYVPVLMTAAACLALAGLLWLGGLRVARV